MLWFSMRQYSGKRDAFIERRRRRRRRRRRYIFMKVLFK
jgi:hypothetical protein